MFHRDRQSTMLASKLILGKKAFGRGVWEIFAQTSRSSAFTTTLCKADVRTSFIEEPAGTLTISFRNTSAICIVLDVRLIFRKKMSEQNV